MPTASTTVNTLPPLTIKQAYIIDNCEHSTPLSPLNMPTSSTIVNTPPPFTIKRFYLVDHTEHSTPLLLTIKMRPPWTPNPPQHWTLHTYNSIKCGHPINNTLHTNNAIRFASLTVLNTSYPQYHQMCLAYLITILNTSPLCTRNCIRTSFTILNISHLFTRNCTHLIDNTEHFTPFYQKLYPPHWQYWTLHRHNASRADTPRQWCSFRCCSWANVYTSPVPLLPQRAGWRQRN